MIARLQQFLTLGLAALALGWLWHFFPQAPVKAVGGFLAICFLHSAIFLLEFAFLRVVGRGDTCPAPTWAELFRAWLGETLVSPQVFFWRQPFRSRAIPDQTQASGLIPGRRGVVFVHGFFCNRGFWNPWLARLRGTGHAFVAVNVEPVFGPIDDYIEQIAAAVEKVRSSTGMPPVLVCHSMGGLAARAWLRQLAASQPQLQTAPVHRIVTIATPHRGTWLARFSIGQNGQQMRLMSDWHGQLGRGISADWQALFICWYSNADNVVFPASNSMLPGADNRLHRACAHVQLAFEPEVMDHTLGLL